MVGFVSAIFGSFLFGGDGGEDSGGEGKGLGNGVEETPRSCGGTLITA